MRLLRFLGLGLLLVALVAAAAAVAISMNQDRIVKWVLARTSSRLGVQIVSSSARLEPRVHLEVILESPRVIVNGRELARAAQAEIRVSYHTLLFDNALPLVALILHHPEVSLAETGAFAARGTLPSLDTETTAAIAHGAHLLSSLTRRVEIVDGALSDYRGSRLLSHIDLIGRTSKHLKVSPWWVKFGFTRDASPAAGSQWSGDLVLAAVPQELLPTVAKGRLWVWNVVLDNLRIAGLTAGGAIQSEVDFALHDNAQAEGTITLRATDITLKNRNPVVLGNYSAGASFAVSRDRIGLTDVALRSGNAALILGGQCRLDSPYANPQIGLSCGGVQIDLTQAKRFLKSGAIASPAWLTTYSDRITRGAIQLDHLALDSSLSDLAAMGSSLRTKLSLDAIVQRVGVAMPPASGLPPLRDFAAQVRYARGVLTVRQGSLRAGNSALSEINASADFRKDFARAPYEVKLKGSADLGDLYPQLAKTAAGSGVNLAQWIEAARGVARFELRAAGRLNGLSPVRPADYGGIITPDQINLKLKTPPAAVTVDGGNVRFAPNRVSLEQLRLALKPGTATVGGDFEIAPRGLRVHDLAVVLDKVPAPRWMSAAVPADQFSAQGDVSGKVVTNVDLAQPSSYAVNGVLTIAPGEIRFGFLRSAILVRSATLTLKGHDAVLSMPVSTLEGQALDMKVGITNLGDPALRIDAVVQRLELEALKFIRLPWEAQTPTIFPAGKASGHVEVRRGNFAALPLSDLTTDFEHDGGNWRVYNLHATSLESRIDLEIIGRAADNWIHMKGRVAGMNSSALFILGGADLPPIAGKLFGDFDLWGDTDTDFFRTLAGKGSIVVKDGKLNRFTLLSRILGLIDLKNWLSANVPDPRATGLPFNFVRASFAGRAGRLHTNDFLLHGPVMDIIGKGSVNVGDSSLAMDLGVLPFQTVSWLIDKIPLIGKSIAQNSGPILAAYFSVHGPVSDPKVTVKPITSAAELVKRVLGLPINLIRPNTVQ
jgi:hypothetical protein